jgi:hypothetical protein
MSNYSTNWPSIEHAVYAAVEKAVHEAVLSELRANHALVAGYAHEALSPDRLKGLVKDFVEYDDTFRDAMKDICVEKLTTKVHDLVDAL